MASHTSRDRDNWSVWICGRRRGSNPLRAHRERITGWSGVDPNRLTPHPGPLPFEGRGSARGRCDDDDYRRARRCSISIGTRPKEHGYRRAQRTCGYNEATNATPSPLKGERAGVRGEAVQINSRPPGGTFEMLPEQFKAAVA